MAAQRTVAVVANSAWNLLNFRSGLLRALRRAGYRVVALAPAGPERDALTELGVDFIPLRHLRRRGMNPLRDLLLLRELRGIFRREGVGAALLYTIKPVIYGSLAASLTGARSFPTLTGLGYTFLSGKSTNLIVRAFYRLALRKSARVFFHNPDDRQLFVEGGLVRAGRARVVGGSGVDLARFTLQDYALAVPRRFLFVARLLTDKGLREYVAAARSVRQRHPDWQFCVLGPADPDNPAGVDPDEFRSWVAEGVIDYRGERTDIRAELAAAAVVVLPSYREGCPRVLLEAAATGRALITTDVPGCREVVVAGENGWLVPVRDAAGLAAAMLAAGGASADELRRMGAYGRQLVEARFAEELVVADYLAALAEEV